MPVVKQIPSSAYSSRAHQVNSVKYESTPSGDVVVVVVESSHEKKGHRRDLSAHFDESTRLTEDDDENQRPVPLYSTKYSSPVAGSKHRRIFSGDVSNPSVAHRRIDSVGQTAPVDRAYYNTSHRRDLSAGLDILSAAADATKEELAAAAGAPAYHDHCGPALGHSQRPPQIYYHSSCSPQPPPPQQHYYHQQHHPPSAHYYSEPPPVAPLQHYHHPNTAPPGSAYPVQYAPTSGVGGKPLHGLVQTAPEGKAEVRPREWQPPTALPVQSYIAGVPTNESKPDKLVIASPHRAASDFQVPEQPIPDEALHNPKPPSDPNMGPLMNSDMLPEPTDIHRNGHHRSTSSSVSFLQGIKETAELLLQGMEAPSPGLDTPLPNFSAEIPHPPAPQPSFVKRPQKEQIIYPRPTVAASQTPVLPLATVTTSRRVRRKCTIEGCTNRVVQGGLCISHGAKRKTCKHPGCAKNVKKAGLCSTHGPARKRCEAEGCSKVAVQGGKCIAHGAKKKLCSVESCTKQAIMSGMCKKHHDLNKGIVKGGRKVHTVTEVPQCVVIDHRKSEERPTHQRGLSIFQEMSAESVESLLAEERTAIHPLKK